ncbi:hypothetical protein HAX54_001016, partial [Datura stramonium]|nr:hypothetical protein [Datura stramonium]
EVIIPRETSSVTTNGGMNKGEELRPDLDRNRHAQNKLQQKVKEAKELHHGTRIGDV